jgi:hypothetical protein
VFQTRFETTETNISVSKQTEKNENKKNTGTEMLRNQTLLKKQPMLQYGEGDMFP